MTLPSFINLSSKTFWLSAAMVLAGLYKMAGIDIPVVPDVELLAQFAPEDGVTLVKLGFMGMFLRDALPAK
jgi:hypothetical protein